MHNRWTSNICIVQKEKVSYDIRHDPDHMGPVSQVKWSGKHQQVRQKWDSKWCSVWVQHPQCAEGVVLQRKMTVGFNDSRELHRHLWNLLENQKKISVKYLYHRAWNGNRTPVWPRGSTAPSQADSLGTGVGDAESTQRGWLCGGSAGGPTPQDVLVDLGGLPHCGVLGAVSAMCSGSSHFSDCVQAYLRSELLGISYRRAILETHRLHEYFVTV